MVNVYLKDEIELELLKIAAKENKDLLAIGNKPNISKSTIAQRIVYAYFGEDKECL